MSPHSQTTLEAPESAQPLAADASGPDATVSGPATSDELGTIAIELNFKAFADHVPPTRHAKRAPNYGDPSVQDFADQALELAALRAELKRLARDYEVVQQQVRLRDARLDALRRELASARAELREARQQPQGPASAARAAAATPAATETLSSTPMPELPPARPELTSTLEIPMNGTDASGPLPASQAAVSSARAAELQVGASPAPAGPRLIPMDQPEAAIALSGDIVTIGRTRASDICIPSRAVSRDHARLLITRSSVTLVDISSTNGCFVNDEPVKRHKLREGDQVRIGDRYFRFTRTSEPAR